MEQFMKKIILIILTINQFLVAKDAIQIYNCYGNAQYIIIDGRVLDTRDFKTSLTEDGVFTNLQENLGHLFNNEKENQSLTLSIDIHKYPIKSDDEGYFHFEATTTPYNYFKHQQRIKLSVDKSNISATCNLTIIKANQQVGIISDFDDTVIVSDVPHKLNLINNVFLKNYKQRTLITKMPKEFKTILGNNSNALFFVTGSPKQLQNNIHKFLDYHHFPKRTLITKKIHGNNSDPLFDQIAYKYAKIQKLILLYPHINWVLFGDSGEKDKEVYSKVKKNFPTKVKAIYIRNVESGKIEKL